MAWSCSHCETLNDDKLTHCEVCGNSHLENEAPEGWWLCPNCETENDPHDAHCDVCGFAKIDALKIKIDKETPVANPGLFGTLPEPAWRTPGLLKIRKKELVKLDDDAPADFGSGWLGRFRKLSPENKRKRIRGWMILGALGTFIFGSGGSTFALLAIYLIFWIGLKIGLPWKKPWETFLETGYSDKKSHKIVEREYEKLEDGHRSPISCVVYNPDGDQLITIDGRGNLMRWLTETGERRKSGALIKDRFDKVLIGTNAAYVLDYNSLKVFRPDGSVRTVIRLKSPKSTTSFSRNNAFVLSPKSLVIATPGEPGKINLINTQNYVSSVLKIPVEEEITTIEFLPDTPWLLVGTETGKLFALDQQNRTATLDIETDGKIINCISADKGKHHLRETFAVSLKGGTVKIYKGLNDNNPASIDLNQKEWGSGSLFEAVLMEFVPGKELLVTVNQVGIIQVWDLLADEPKLLQVLATANDDIRDIAVSPDGKRITAGCGDGTVSTFEISIDSENTSRSGLKGSLTDSSEISSEEIEETSLAYGESEYTEGSTEGESRDFS